LSGQPFGNFTCIATYLSKRRASASPIMGLKILW
jgi:hypothetical protein